MTIKTITARSDDAEMSDIYMLLNMIHAMAGIQACKKVGGWELKNTATYEDYVLTVWTNNIVDIKAETHKYWNGDIH